MYGIPMQRLRYEKNVLGINGNGIIRYETIPLTMVMGQHSETINFYIYDLPEGIPIILGNPWLKKHCPTIEFDHGNIRFSSQYCKRNCCATAEEIARRVEEKRRKEEEERRNKIQLAKEIINYKVENNKDNCIRLDNDDFKSSLEIKKNKAYIRKVCSKKAVMKKALVKKNKSLKRKNLNKDKIENYVFYCVSKTESKNKVLRVIREKCENVKRNTSIDREKQDRNKINIKDEVKEEIPEQYKEYKCVFDERECDKLPPHRLYDCKIRLKDDVDLFYGPLYPLNEEEREALKEYIQENLKKVLSSHQIHLLEHQYYSLERRMVV